MSSRKFAIIGALLVTAFSLGTASGQVWLRATAVGSGGPTGDVGDFWGAGVGLGADAYAEVVPGVQIGAGLAFSVNSGQDFPSSDIEWTTSAVGFFFHAGGRFVIPTEEVVLPFVGLSVGRGGYAWVYGDLAAEFMGHDSDACGFFFVSPMAGAIFTVSENAGFSVDLRYFINAYDDKTSEGLIWTVDGGNFLQFRGSLEYQF